MPDTRVLTREEMSEVIATEFDNFKEQVTEDLSKVVYMPGPTESEESRPMTTADVIEQFSHDVGKLKAKFLYWLTGDGVVEARKTP